MVTPSELRYPDREVGAGWAEKRSRAESAIDSDLRAAWEERSDKYFIPHHRMERIMREAGVDPWLADRVLDRYRGHWDVSLDHFPCGCGGYFFRPKETG